MNARNDVTGTELKNTGTFVGPGSGRSSKTCIVFKDRLDIPYTKISAVTVSFVTHYSVNATLFLLVEICGSDKPCVNQTPQKYSVRIAGLQFMNFYSESLILHLSLSFNGRAF